MVGSGRCCIRDDDPNDYTHHPVRRRGSRQILHWEKRHRYTQDPGSKLLETLGEKARGLGNLVETENPEDGVYCECETTLMIPQLGDFIPTSARWIPPPDDVATINVRIFVKTTTDLLWCAYFIMSNLLLI